MEENLNTLQAELADLTGSLEQVETFLRDGQDDPDIPEGYRKRLSRREKIRDELARVRELLAAA